MNRLKRLRAWMRQTKRCSPAGFALMAVSLLFVFVVAHLLGLREYTSILSGTVPQGTVARGVKEYFAVIYILVYLGAVIAAPILAIASLAFFLLDRRLSFLTGWPCGRTVGRPCEDLEHHPQHSRGISPDHR